MPRIPKIIGNDLAVPSSPNQVIGTLFLVQEGSATELHLLDFLEGGIEYYGKTIKQSFEYVLIDNIGSGEIRIAFNILGMDLSNPIKGAKTLRAGDSLYIQDSVRNVSLYFLQDSIVELVVITK